jgi:hypothetical protein
MSFHKTRTDIVVSKSFERQFAIPSCADRAQRDAVKKPHGRKLGEVTDA